MASVAESGIAHKLLVAAVRLFAQKGYPATTTREIVEAAGVTKPMLYYYFQNKEGLLKAAMEHFLDMFYQRLRQVASEPREPREHLAELVWAHFEYCLDHKPLARLFYALYFGPDDQKHLVDLQKYADQTEDLLDQGVARAVAARLVRADCDADFSMALRGMINIWVMAALNKEAELNVELARKVVDDLLRGYQNC